MHVLTVTFHQEKNKMKVKEKLTEFYKSNNLGIDGGVDKDWNKFEISYFTFLFPNLNKKGYLLHDVNHLLCGYGIDWFGEFETAAWEIGSGGRKGFGLSWFYPITGFLLGLILIPKRTIAAYNKGRKRKNAHLLSKKYKVLEMEIEELKKLSHNDETKINDRP